MTLSVPSTPATASGRSLADLLKELGGISADRVRLFPYPGTATVDDVDFIEQHEDRLFELIDGVLVEKILGYAESVIAVAIAAAIRNFVIPRKLGVVSGSDGMMQLFARMVRIPDVAFVSFARFPGGSFPKESIPGLVPDLAIEVLSKGNTAREMKKKLADYFKAGVLLVWFVDPRQQTATVFTPNHPPVIVSRDQSLDGSPVLAGFVLPIDPLFVEVGL